jgi:hypothetical protein
MRDAYRFGCATGSDRHIQKSLERWEYEGDPLRSYASVRLCGDAGPYHLESLIPHPNPVVTYSGQTKENPWLTRKSVKILPVPVPRPKGDRFCGAHCEALKGAVEVCQCVHASCGGDALSPAT